jgi:uncharacterized membrane protein
MTRDARISALVFGGVMLSILLLAVGASALLAAGGSPLWRLPFRLVCHGIETRCFQLWGVSMPICARCTGIYAGGAGAAFLFLTLPALRRHPLPLRALPVLILPLAIDGGTQLLRFRESTNDLRLVTGLIAGLSFLLWALGEIECNGRRLGQGRPLSFDQQSQ